MADSPYQLQPFSVSTGQGGSSVPTTGSTSSGSSSSSQSSQQSVEDTADAQLSRMISSVAQSYGDQVFQWAQSQIPGNNKVTNEAVGQFMQAANADFNLANTTQNEYNQIGAPQLANLNNTANAYSSTAAQQVAAGSAEANSEQGSQAGISNAEQTLQGAGINLNSGMYANLEASQKAAAGAAAAASGTQAAQQVKTTGIGLQQGALAADQQLPGQSVNASVAGQGAVTGGVNAKLANTSTNAQALDAANPFYATAQNIAPEGMQGSSSGSSSSTQSSNSFGNTNYNGAPTVTGSGDFAAKGGPIGALPTDDATTGGFVSRHLSPSGGGVTDDIPARLNADEFVMPKDVTRYYGHKQFQDMIIKARKAMGDPAQSPAKPEMKPTHAAAGGAIPTGW